MKLIIQIPCYNEETTLETTLNQLPRELAGVNCVEWLIVDDGSTDRTREVAQRCGVDHVIRFPENRGLAKAFMAGLEAGLAAGADIIVNTDADNQYFAGDIPNLIAPILEGKAEMVIGARPIAAIEHFSPFKKMLQLAGSWAVRKASATNIADAPSGFRAISRRAAMQLNVFNEYTYTLETIIQAGHKGIAVASVPIRVNEDLRPSRLVKSMGSYVKRSVWIICRIFMTYKPLKFFLILGAIPFSLGILICLRFLVFYLMGAGAGKVQSLILASILLGFGFMLLIVGLLADLISTNRVLLEKVLWRVRQVEEHQCERSRTDGSASGTGT